jgi:hypothetical protein
VPSVAGSFGPLEVRRAVADVDGQPAGGAEHHLLQRLGLATMVVAASTPGLTSCRSRCLATPRAQPGRTAMGSLNGTELANPAGDTLEETSRGPSVASSGSGPPCTWRFRSAPLRTFPMVRTTSLEPATFFGLAHAGSL